MTPRERLLAAWRGETPDRVPIISHCAEPYRDMDHARAEVHDPRRLTLIERIIDHCFHRQVYPAHVNRFLCTPPQFMHETRETFPDGSWHEHGIIETPKGDLHYERRYDPRPNTVWMEEYPVKTAEDIRRIQSVPWELPAGLEVPARYTLPAGLEHRAITATGFSCPMVCVAAMMQFEQFLELTATDRDWMRELVEIVTARELDIMAAMFASPGIELVWMGGSEWLTPPMGSPAVYDDLVQPYEAQTIAYVHEHTNAIVHTHCHGSVRHALRRTIERGSDYTEPVEPPPDGDITMAEAKALAAGRITLGGNVECRVLCNESAAVLEAAVRAAFAGGTERFVFTPTDAPNPTVGEHEMHNWLRMFDLWEELSPIP